MLEEDFFEAIVKGDSQRVVRLLGQITDTGPIKVTSFSYIYIICFRLYVIIKRSYTFL